MNKKLKLTKLTVSNLERIKGGDLICRCPLFNEGSTDEAQLQISPQSFLTCKTCAL